MKFIMFTMSDVAKGAEVAQIGDKIKTPGNKLLGWYVCGGKPFDGVPPNTMVAISIHEFENNEALAAVEYPLALTGATVWAVPVLEVPRGHAAAEVKKLQK
jgi:hypothetical protein